MISDAQHRQLYDYLEGSLSQEQSAALESELAQSPELQEELALKRAILAAIQEEGREELRGFLKERLFEESTDKQTGLWLVAAATVATLIVSTLIISGQFGAGQFLKNQSMVEAEQMEADGELPPSRIKAYKRKNEPSALSELDSLNYLPGEAMAINEDSEMAADLAQSDDITFNFGDAAPPLSEAPRPMSLGSTRIKIIDLGYAVAANSAPAAVRPSVSRQRVDAATAGRIAEAESSLDSKDTLPSKPKPKAAVYARVEWFSQSSDDPAAPMAKRLTAANERVYQIFNLSAENYLILHLNGLYYLSLDNRYYSLPLKENTLQPLVVISDPALVSLLEQSE
ncbi:MAG: anti-sigma factor family protein [Bacteroidia bacterium]